MLQNRVDPWGMLRTVPDRGSLMGSEGVQSGLRSAQPRRLGPCNAIEM